MAELRGCLNEHSLGCPNTMLEQQQNLCEQVHQTIRQLDKREKDYSELVQKMLKFFDNIVELHSIVEKQKDLLRTLPHLRCPVDLLEKEYISSRTRVYDTFKQTSGLADQIHAKVFEVEPKEAAEADASKIMPLLITTRKTIDDFFELYKKTVTSHRQLLEFNSDLRAISDQIDELTVHLNSLRGNYGESLNSAKATSQAFTQFERTIQLLQETKMKAFISTSDKMLKESDSPHVSFELANLMAKWKKLNENVGDNRILIDLIIKYFELMDEADIWMEKGSKLMDKQNHSFSLNDLRNLVNEMETFMAHGHDVQERKVQLIVRVSNEIQDKNGSNFSMAQFKKRNANFHTAFTATLNMLREKIRLDEDKDRALKEATSRVVSPVVDHSTSTRDDTSEQDARAPTFTVDLKDEVIQEGSKYTFLCRVDGLPEPHGEFLFPH